MRLPLAIHRLTAISVRCRSAIGGGCSRSVKPTPRRVLTSQPGPLVSPATSSFPRPSFSIGSSDANQLHRFSSLKRSGEVRPAGAQVGD